MKVRANDTSYKIREVRAARLESAKEIEKMKADGNQLLVQFRGNYYKLFCAMGEDVLIPREYGKEFSYLLRIQTSQGDIEGIRFEVLEILKGPI
jgi:hypothetical protein